MKDGSTIEIETSRDVQAQSNVFTQSSQSQSINHNQAKTLNKDKEEQEELVFKMPQVIAKSY